jgi:hypothetical protein
VAARALAQRRLLHAEHRGQPRSPTSPKEDQFRRAASAGCSSRRSRDVGPARLAQRRRVVADQRQHDRPRRRPAETSTKTGWRRPASACSCGATSGLTYFVGNRYIDELTSNITTDRAQYESAPSTSSAASQSYDFGLSQNVSSERHVSSARSSGAGAGQPLHDSTSDETSFNFSIAPKGIGYGLNAAQLHDGVQDREPVAVVHRQRPRHPKICHPERSEGPWSQTSVIESNVPRCSG